MESNYIKIESLAKLENISAIRICITTFLSELDIYMGELMDIKTSISEAVTNVVEHAYSGNNYNEAKIIAEAKVSDGENISIVITDYGKGIENISLAMTPAYTSKPDSEHAGMGFTIMEAFMDEVIVDSKVGEGTVITMNKKIKSKKTKA